MSRRQELAAKRATLVARCERQRRELGIATDGVAHSLRVVDAAVSVTRRAATHPLILAGAVVAVIVVFRPRRLMHFLTLGLSAAVAARRMSTLWRAAA
jgi:hypothetical protein